MIFRRALLVAACISAISSSAFSADWTMGRFGPEQGSSTSEKLTLPLSLSWEFTASKFDNNPASPVVAKGVCYFASGDRVYAVDLETGAQKWKYPVDQGLSGSVKDTPAVCDGMVYFGAGDGNLYCLDADTGAFQWAYQTRGSIRCSPVILDGVIYFGSDDDSLYAINATTGEEAWRFTSRDDIAVGVGIGVGMAIVASMDGNMYGVSLGSSGKLRWNPFRLSSAPVQTSPVVMEKVVAMAVGDTMYGLTTRSGMQRWLVKLPYDVAATPAVDGTDIYVPCRNKKIYAYSAAGRQPTLKWTEPAELGTSLMSSPIIAGDMMFVTGSKGLVAAFSKLDGSLKWRYVASPSPITMSGQDFTDAASSPTVANGALLVVTDDGVLHCFTHDAPDSEPPGAFGVKPANGSVMNGAPPIKMSAVLYDVGSGVDFSSVTISLDGFPTQDYTVDPSTSTVSYETSMGTANAPIKALNDGVHTVTVTAKDYKGNLLTNGWFFTVDNNLPQPNRVKPEVQPGKKTKEPPKGRSRYPSSRTAPESDASSPPPPPPMPPPMSPPMPTPKF